LKKISLIDADGLLYTSSKETIEESIISIDEKIKNIIEKTEADFVSLFISEGKYFRHDVMNEYKQQRKSYPTKLKFIKTLKSYLVEKYSASSHKRVEADDLVSYWYNEDICINNYGVIETRQVFESALDLCKSENTPLFEFESMQKTICSPDKDLLKSIQGRHFNYYYRENKETGELEKGSWIETTDLEALSFRTGQMIIGDPSDNIIGLRGKGDAFWKSLVKKYESIPSYGVILNEYIAHHNMDVNIGIMEFQKTYRALRILSCSSDFESEGIDTPDLLTVAKFEDCSEEAKEAEETNELNNLEF
jgi:5'-3' exonuclease